MFKHIGDKFSTYTYTDISPSFFEQSAQTFPSPQMVFKVLDLEKDVEAQGFQPGSYDLVVASNVLHATRRLEASLRAARRLLKPGGYLLVCEMTAPDVLRVRLAFSGLAGWWLGRENDDGRALTATIDTLEWDERLRRTGFSGIDAISDESNVLALAGNVMVSQAVDERVNRLRNPLAEPTRGPRSDAAAAPVPAQQPVVIVGGLRPASAALAGRIACHLAQRCSAVLKTPCLEAVAHLDLPRACGVVNLSDLDKPALQDPTEASLAGLKRLFAHPRTVLWVTNGCADESPFQNMSLGLGRVLMAEMPAGRLQFLDLGGQIGQDSSRIISASYLRWRALSDLDTDLEAGTLLWSREHELVYDGDGFKVPRIAFDEAMNTRYMASRRPITREVAIEDVPVALDREGARWSFTEQVSPPLTKRSPDPPIRVAISSLAPCFNGWHLALGEYSNGGGSVMALTRTQESILQSPAAVLPISSTIPRESWPRAASLLTREMQVTAIMDHIPYEAVALLWEPPAALAALISERQSVKRASFVFLTSLKQAGGNGFPWTSVGGNFTSKQMRQLVPDLEMADVLIDCSSTPSLAHRLSTSGIDRVLPPRAWRTSIGDIASRGSITPSDPASLLRSARMFATGMLGISSSQEGVLSSMPLKACDELNTAEVLYNASNLLVDWQISRKITVGVSPVDQFVRFSGTKTYVLFGLISDLGQSIAEWLATQGARHIALTSRNPRIAESWTGLMSAAGVDLKGFSR